MSYALYVAYHLLFLVAAIMGAYRSRLTLVVYVAACFAVGFLTDSVVPAADLNWYRTIFDELSSDNILLFILANDFEAFWGLAVLASKFLLPSDFASLGACSFLILLLPLCWADVRSRLEYLSLLMIFPGSFLIMFNTMRQGFSEYFILSSLLSGSLLLTLASGLTHRFGFIVGILSQVVRWISPWIVMVPALLFALMYWRLLVVFSPDNDMQSIYAQLDPSYASFVLKVTLYSLPYLMARWSRRKLPPPATPGADKAWRVANSASLIMIGVTVISLLVHPRLADRIAFYILPVAVWAWSRAGAAKMTKALFYCVILILGLSSMFLGSHREFFDKGVVVTDELEHGE